MEVSSGIRGYVMKALKNIGWGKALRFVWWSMFQMLIHWCIVPQVRVVLLRLAGARIGDNSIVGDVDFLNVYHYGFRRLVIGRDCFIGDHTLLDVRGGVNLGDQVTLSARSAIVSHINVGYRDHPLQKVYPTREAAVHIGRGSFIGTGAILLPGVRVGNMSVVGAGAVVTKAVPDHAVVVGVPARVVKKIRI